MEAGIGVVGAAVSGPAAGKLAALVSANVSVANAAAVVTAGANTTALADGCCSNRSGLFTLWKNDPAFVSAGM